MWLSTQEVADEAKEQSTSLDQTLEIDRIE